MGKLPPELLRTKQVFIGFDGFIDRIIRPIKQVGEAEHIYFATIEEFGQFLCSKSAKSCSVELDIQTTKIGGNMPIFANAIGGFEVLSHCVGMLGKDEIHPIYKSMPPQCKLYTYRESIYSDCLEFTDGKVMMASRCELDGKALDKIRSAVPRIGQLLTESNISVFLNWSELVYSHALWSDMYTDFFSKMLCDKEKFIFFDLCDCSRKSSPEILSVLSLIQNYTTVRQTVLSVNENEANVLSNAVFGAELEPAEFSKRLCERYKIDQLIVHTVRTSYLWAGDTWYKEDTIFCEKPMISTGAGDHFNAGYCLGLLLELPPEKRLLLANRITGFYINSGTSPALSEVIPY